MILNIPPMKIIVCLASLIVSATASAQTFNGSLRRQAVEPTEQQRAPQVDWGTLRNTTSTSERSRDDRSFSDSSARILMDGTTNVVDLRNSPDQPIGRPSHQTSHSAQPISSPQRHEPPSVRHASYEATPRQTSNTIATNNVMPPPTHDVSEPEVDPTTAKVPSQPNDMAPLNHAFNSIRSEQAPRHQQAEVPPQSDPSIRRLDSKHPSDEAELASDGTGQSNLDTTSTKGFPSLGDSGSRQLIEKIAYNTLFVLVFGVGFVFIAKVWIKPNKGQSQIQQDGIEVISSLKLPAKSNLMLVNVSGEKLLVALDASGVKSVVHLTDSFANKLAAYSEIEDEVPEMEQRFEESLASPTPTKRTKTKSKSPVYSLDSVLGERETKQAAPKDNAEKNTEAIREQMEAALLKFGLKGLV